MFLSGTVTKVLLLFLIYLAVNLVFYNLIKQKYRYLLLLFTGLICYVLISKFASIYIFITILITYCSGLYLNKIKKDHPRKGLEKSERKIVKKRIKKLNKRVVVLYTIISLSILVSLKYLNFFSGIATDIYNVFGNDSTQHIFKFIVPIGISYYTLIALSYVIDVSRGKYKAETNIFKLALFISFFPCIYMGPFSRYDDIGPSLSRGEKLNFKNIYEGFITILIGFFKVFFIANRAVIISDYIFKHYTDYGGFAIILAAVMFTIDLYAEFSGFIDITRGIAKCFNIDLPKNFDKPFFSKSVSEFWTRWHISLGAFFKDYVFYPVSLSKKLRKITNKLPNCLGEFLIISISLFCVWILMGLWHGANLKYLIYGMYFLAFMIIYNIFSPLTSKVIRGLGIKENNVIINILNIIRTNLIVIVGLMMFRASNLDIFRSMFASIFSFNKKSIDLFNIIDVKDFIVLIIGLIIVMVPLLLKKKNIDLLEKYNSLNNYYKYGICAFIALLILIYGAYGNGYIPPDPIYGGF